ncbi:hypothetical protein INT44_003715 [Umbelopsis vinacea]|uniref:polynucleotide adenylyltransferase n=1 Tax=Umbelopsis vinacea TaxID=44442 RepID=A0A8H7PUZ1_9FUNG|nr:hypothetical protein INT44_003715 [Umbelopsis vinacea]KAI9288798.1 hypothetical protein BC943DRAFT_356797 [Umbelopsis sp. AD052]
MDSAGPSTHLREKDFTGDDSDTNDDYIAFDISDNESTKSELDSAHDKASRRNTDHESKKSSKRPPDESWKRYIDDGLTRPWAKDFRYRKARNIGERLNMEMTDLVEYLSPTEEEHTMRRFAVHRIRQCAQMVYPSCTVEVFGSFETRLYLPTSDIDLVLFYDGKDARDTTRVLSRLADALRKQGITYTVQVIAKARVPIIKFEETFTGYQIDVSLNTANGVHSAEVVKEMLVQAPALGPLTLIFKHLLGLLKLNEVFTGGLGSYAVVLMVMSCLQTHPKVDMSDAMDNLGVIFVDLLELYGQHFNIYNVGIDVAKKGFYEKMETRNTFAVRDPTDASNDVSRGSFNCQQIRIALKDAFNTLTRAITSLNRQVWDFHKKDDGISLLGCIIHVDRQAIMHRSQVLDAYTSQQWKDMPGAETFDASDNESSAKEQVIVHKQQDVLDKKGKRRSKKDIVYVLEDEDREFKGKGNAWSSGEDDLSLPQLA